MAAEAEMATKAERVIQLDKYRELKQPPTLIQWHT